MLKFLSVFVVFILILLSDSMVQVLETQKEDETQKEYVEVINVEVIVRALKNGQLKGGLKQSDFTIYENGQKQEITSFMEVRRRIGTESEDMEKREEESWKKAGRKRLFLFYFWVYEPGSRYQETLDYFFKSIYREGDYALLIIENQVFKITRKEQIPQTLAQVKIKLDEVTREGRMEHKRLIDSVEELFSRFEEQYLDAEEEAKRTTRRYVRGGRKQRLIERFGTNYKHLWDEYKYKRIHINVNKLKALAASLKTVNFDKWGLIFYQQDTFPQFDIDKFFSKREKASVEFFESRKIFEIFSREMRKPSASLSIIEEIQQAFIDANATFFLLLSQVDSLRPLEFRYLEIENIYSDWQAAFKNISKATGGEVIDGNKLKQALVKAVKKEDIYYRITYAPKITEKKIREIEVKTSKKRLKVLYNRQVILKKASEIVIDNFSFTYPTLQFTLNNFQQLFDGNRLYGDLGIKVTAVDSKGEMLTIEKAFEPDEEKIIVSFKLNFPHGGEYTLIVEALDKQTGKSSIYSEKIKAPETSFDKPVLITKVHKKTEGIDKTNRLNVILDKAAKYCERLEKTTFYFTCKEEVADIYFIKGKKVKDDLYLHDYQILMEENGKMSEKREPVRKKSHKKKRKKKKKNGENFFLTTFFSEYPFLMPVTMLSRENQKNYRYRLFSKEKVGKVKTFKLSVEPKKKGEGVINHGVVWVDEKDGSVVKIELNPASLIGIRALKTTARKKGTRIRVTDIHWYGVKRNRVRFPTRTEISEVNLARHGGDIKEPEEVEHSRTVFSYKKYRFFKVNVNVVDTSHK